MKIIVFLLTCVIKIMVVQSRNFTRCELVPELLKQGFPENQLRDWVCLIEAESSGRTDAVGGPDDDGSYDYGLFQINNRYWCSATNRAGKGCHLRCSDLLEDDITVASKCAQRIYSIQGFEAWVGWVNECQTNLPDLRSCIVNNVH